MVLYLERVKRYRQVRLLTEEKLQILRPGPISLEELESVL